jgi:multidrug resistance efflux pump
MSVATVRPATLSDRVRSLRLPESATEKQPRNTWLPWMLCILFAGLNGYQAMKGTASEPTPGTQDTTPAAAAAKQQTAASTERKSANSRPPLRAGGYITPVRKVQVSPKVGGEVQELFIEEGQHVKKGTVLAKLDRSRYEFVYRQMQAAAEQAKAKYDKLVKGNRDEEKKQSEAALHEAEQIRNQLRDELDRLRRSRNAASAEEIVRVQSRLGQAEYKVLQMDQAHRMMLEGPRPEEIEEAKQAYLLAVAQRDNAKYDLDNAEVVAPVSGVILVKRAEVGNTVRPEAFSNGLSASLCDMADLRELEVDVDISERDLDQVSIRQRCEIRTEAFPNKVYTGYLHRLMPEANRSKASVSGRVRIDVPENDMLLRPEMRASVIFLNNK